jgi:hypothetical protein
MTTRSALQASAAADGNAATGRLSALIVRRWCFGKTPMQTFVDAMPMTKEKMIAA